MLAYGIKFETLKFLTTLYYYLQAFNIIQTWLYVIKIFLMTNTELLHGILVLY